MPQRGPGRSFMPSCVVQSAGPPTLIQASCVVQADYPHRDLDPGTSVCSAWGRCCQEECQCAAATVPGSFWLDLYGSS